MWSWFWFEPFEGDCKMTRRSGNSSSLRGKRCAFMRHPVASIHKTSFSDPLKIAIRSASVFDSVSIILMGSDQSFLSRLDSSISLWNPVMGDATFRALRLSIPERERGSNPVDFIGSNWFSLKYKPFLLVVSEVFAEFVTIPRVQMGKRLSISCCRGLFSAAGSDRSHCAHNVNCAAERKAYSKKAIYLYTHSSLLRIIESL